MIIENSKKVGPAHQWLDWSDKVSNSVNPFTILNIAIPVLVLWGKVNHTIDHKQKSVKMEEIWRDMTGEVV